MRTSPLRPARPLRLFRRAGKQLRVSVAMVAPISITFAALAVAGLNAIALSGRIEAEPPESVLDAWETIPWLASTLDMRGNNPCGLHDCKQRQHKSGRGLRWWEKNKPRMGRWWEMKGRHENGTALKRTHDTLEHLHIGNGMRFPHVHVQHAVSSHFC